MALSASTEYHYLKELLKEKTWKDALTSEFKKSYFIDLEEKLQNKYNQGKVIYPPRDLIFYALELTPLDKVKVVILGQDPYHGYGQAMGLAYSVQKGQKIPPSLRNIYTELKRDPKILEFNKPDHGCLVEWAEEGVLLLNATLTVEAGDPNSHDDIGWQTFTDAIIKAVNDNCDHVVFLLMGKDAQKKEEYIYTPPHAIIKTAHPSPLSVANFKECNCFSDCNKELKKFGLPIMNWNLS